VPELPRRSDSKVASPALPEIHFPRAAFETVSSEKLEAPVSPRSLEPPPSASDFSGEKKLVQKIEAIAVAKIEPVQTPQDHEAKLNEIESLIKNAGFTPPFFGRLAKARENAEEAIKKKYARGYLTEFWSKKDSEAVPWIKSSAELGDLNAQFHFARILWSGGSGMAVNREEAVKWYRKSAEQGEIAAQWYLGAVYEGGQGIKRNKAQSAYWHGLAAAKGDRGSKKALKRMGLPEDWKIYKVRAGDNFTGIGEKLKLSLVILEKYNPGVDPNKLRVGQEILIPVILPKEREVEHVH
jgi:TPR repeat protein